MNKENKLFNHSIIIDFPIDYDLYPLAKNVDIIKIVLEKDEYLILPPLWFHCVYTDPETIAVSYKIWNIKGKDEDKDSDLYNSLINNIPIKCNGNKTNISYSDFINNSLYNNFRVILSKTNDCSPVIKNNNIKICIHDDTLLNSIKYAKTENMYAYFGNEVLKKNSFIEDYTDIEKLIKFDNTKTKTNTISLNYHANLWFNLEKNINSGLHQDTEGKILYVLTGKKTFYLIHPEEKNNLYLTEMTNFTY